MTPHDTATTAKVIHIRELQEQQARHGLFRYYRIDLPKLVERLKLENTVTQMLGAELITRLETDSYLARHDVERMCFAATTFAPKSDKEKVRGVLQEGLAQLWRDSMYISAAVQSHFVMRYEPDPGIREKFQAALRDTPDRSYQRRDGILMAAPEIKAFTHAYCNLKSGA